MTDKPGKTKPLLRLVLSDREREVLEEAISDVLPPGCELVTPIRVRGMDEELWVLGTIRVEPELMSATPTLLGRVHQIIERHIQRDKELYVAIEPQAAETKETLRRDWDRLLEEVWQVKPFDALADPFRLVKSGRKKEARKALEKANVGSPRQDDGNEETSNHDLLRAWIQAEVVFPGDNPDSGAAEEADKVLSRLLEQPGGGPAHAMLLAWQLVRRAAARQDGLDELRARVSNVLKAQRLPTIVRAECAFALGYDWERRSDFDLDHSNDYYLEASNLYLQSKMPSEADRLNNSWGHQRTLLFELGKAVVLLEESLRVKKLKDDLVGLAMTYGSLGDAYSRLTEFERADRCYEEDIRLIRETGNLYQLSGVIRKQAQSWIRRGLLERDRQPIEAGLSRLRELRQSGDDGSGAFFTLKELARGELAMASFETDPSLRTLCIDRASACIAEMEATRPYFEAFRERLNGRLHGLGNDIDRARTHLARAAELFRRMGRGEDERRQSLQSIACDLESTRYLAAANDNCEEKVRVVLANLSEFLVWQGASLDEAGGLIRQRIRLVERGINSHRGSNAHSAALEAIDQIVALIEG